MSSRRSQVDNLLVMLEAVELTRLEIEQRDGAGRDDDLEALERLRERLLAELDAIAGDPT